ncbi:Uncharacterized protein K02A2.6, partial [Paramuricea clavata]
MANLEEVLRRLHHHGLRANKSKCEFFKEKITFCGHDINSEGLHKTTDKTAAMVNAPRPQSVAEYSPNLLLFLLLVSEAYIICLNVFGCYFAKQLNTKSIVYNYTQSFLFMNSFNLMSVYTDFWQFGRSFMSKKITPFILTTFQWIEAHSLICYERSGLQPLSAMLFANLGPIEFSVVKMNLSCFDSFVNKALNSLPGIGNPIVLKNEQRISIQHLLLDIDVIEMEIPLTIAPSLRSRRLADGRVIYSPSDFEHVLKCYSHGHTFVCLQTTSTSIMSPWLEKRGNYRYHSMNGRYETPKLYICTGAKHIKIGGTQPRSQALPYLVGKTLARAARSGGVVGETAPRMSKPAFRALLHSSLMTYRIKLQLKSLPKMTLASAEKPADKNFDEIVSTLQKHLNPKPLEIAERFRFYKINQQEGQSILSYIAELKKLTTHCNFGSNLEETLRDRLLCGLSNQQIQKRLLAESKLKFSKAVDIAVAMETATRDATEIHSKGREEKPLGLDKLTLNRPSNSSDRGPPSPVVCYRCGANTHVATECRFKKEVCHKCGKRGHIQRACQAQQSQGPGRPSPRSRYQKSTNAVETEPDEYEHLLNNLEVHNVNKSNSDVIWVDVKVENQPLSMELDTGSAVSILPYDMFLERFRDKKLEKTTTVLKTYTGELIVPVGCLTMQVEYLDQSCLLPLHVVQTKGPVLMGRDWLHKLRLDWKTIKLLKSSDSSHRNPEVEEELKRLQSEGILSKVEWSDWATPIVPVPKQDGSVRICGDSKGTINPTLQAEQYPLPRIEDIFAHLAGGKKFSKIDLRQAYHQIELEEESKKYLTINTSMGLFQYNRLVFGITSAPAIWQRTMDQILEGTSGISCILDDMIVTGKSDAEHMANLEEVLRRLHHHGVLQRSGIGANEAGKVPLHPWEWPTTPWQRIHLDFAGPFQGRMFLIIVDAHSKWPEVEIMPSTTSTQTIDRLRTIFARYGVPAQVVTDNGPQFTSAEFQLFLKTNGIKHITTAPFHPATNGQAERFVQSFKHAMKCEKQSASQLKTNMAKFLLAYRNTPHSTTGESPSVLFLGRPLRTRLDLVKPDLQRKVMNRQIDQAGRKGHSPTRQLSIGQTVMARNYSGKDKWLPGIVRAQTGPLAYEIKVGPNRIWRRHIDQLRTSSVKVNDQSDDTAEPHPELGETGQNIAPAEEIVAEPDIELATNPPVVQQQEADHTNHPRDIDGQR